MFIIESWEALLKLNVGQSTVCNGYCLMRKYRVLFEKGINVGEGLFGFAFYSNEVLRYTH